MASAVAGLAVLIGTLTINAGDTLPPQINVPVLVEPDSHGIDESGLAVAENDIFTVIGSSFNDVRSVERISAALRGLASGWLALERRPQQLIAVQLIDRQHRPGDDQYHIQIDGRGGVTVSLSWNEDLPLALACEALARAYLVKVLWQYHPDLDAETIPDWLVFALGASLEVEWISGRRKALIERAKANPPLGLDEILNATGPYGERRDWVAVESYWLLRFLRAEWRRLPQSLWLTFLAGSEPDWAIVADHSATPSDRRGRELWWAVGRADLILSRSSPVLSLDESRDLVARMGYVVFEDETRDYRMPANAILDLEQPEPYISFAADQARISKMLLVRINPVYYNALIALGFFYESMTNGDFTAAAAHFDQFLADFATATQLHEEINRLLEDF